MVCLHWQWWSDNLQHMFNGRRWCEAKSEHLSLVGCEICNRESLGAFSSLLFWFGDASINHKCLFQTSTSLILICEVHLPVFSALNYIFSSGSLLLQRNRLCHQALEIIRHVLKTTYLKWQISLNLLTNKSPRYKNCTFWKLSFY